MILSNRLLTPLNRARRKSESGRGRFTPIFERIVSTEVGSGGPEKANRSSEDESSP